jgi:hypothetical protein
MIVVDEKSSDAWRIAFGCESEKPFHLRCLGRDFRFLVILENYFVI